LLSARCTLQMILYRNFPHLSTLIFNFFQKNQKTSTIHPIFALLADPAARGRPRSSILSPLSLQNRAQHILII